MFSQRTLFIIFAILFGALSRLIPHAPNFTAIGAIALFGGAYLTNRYLAIFVPVLAVWISDVVLNNTLYTQPGQFVWFYEGAWLQYATTALCAVMGIVMMKKVNVKTITAGSVATALVFFAITNFGVWYSSTMYAQTLTGLAASYIAALPFLGFTLLGNLFFSGILFGGFELAGRRFPKLAYRKA